MELDELEKEMIGLAGEIRKEELPESIVSSTLSILNCHCEKRSLRRGNPALSVIASGARQSRLPVIASGARQSLFPVLSTLFLFALFLTFFSFSLEPSLNIIRLLLLFFSITMGSIFFFKPKTMAEIDRKILGGRLSRIGPAATHSQEIVLFRVQAVYFILIAFFICRL